MGLFDFLKPKPQPPTQTTPLETPKFLILVVDDEQFIRDFYQELLTKEGYKVMTVNNGQEGLNAANQYKPDLILLDIMMPVMDGMTTLNELQKNPVTAQIPVIMLTNAGSINNMEQAKYNLVYSFLIKSNVSPEEVIKIIIQLFTGRKPTSLLIDQPLPITQTTPTQTAQPTPPNQPTT